MLPSYFLAISCRCHRSSVSGVITVPISKSPLRATALALTASRRRCRSLNRRRLPPSCSRRARFSACRYSIKSCWCRFTQPAKINIKNCSGGEFIDSILDEPDCRNCAENDDCARLQDPENVMVSARPTFGTLRDTARVAVPISESMLPPSSPTVHSIPRALGAEPR